ncbi:MAG TPA: glycosyltransferase, partial [Polyangiaceae bacterium]|nr:glycosyltransferase [Polyangiaceae bacterium]
MQLLAIVVNYRTAALTIEAVRSLLAALGQMPDARVIVVDNDSQDGSFEDLCRTIPAFDTDGRVTIVASPLNGGFGYGVNVGVRHGLSAPSPPSHFYLLNSDAFPAPSAVSELIAFFERHPQAGIAGSHIHGTDGEPHKTAFRFPSMLSEVERALRLGVASKVLARWRVPMPAPEGDCEVDWVAG